MNVTVFYNLNHDVTMYAHVSSFYGKYTVDSENMDLSKLLQSKQPFRYTLLVEYT